MSTSQLIDSVVICPYDKNHRIARSRIQRHIVKCEKNYPANYKIICPYDATHRLFKFELEDHVVSCPKRSLLEPEDYRGTQKHGQINSNLSIELTNEEDCEENWDTKLKNNFAYCISQPTFIDFNHKK